KKWVQLYKTFRTEHSQTSISRALQKLSLSRAAQKLIPLHNHPPAAQHHIRHAGNLNAFEHRVINAHVVRLGADGVLALGIEDDHVSVAAYCDRSLARVETEQLRRRC